MTDSPTIRELPAGHDDQSSPYWIMPEHRDTYQRIIVKQAAIAKEVETHKATVDREEDLAIWQEHHDRKASGDPSTYRQWLARYAYPDGRPRLSLVGNLDGSMVRTPNVERVLTPEQLEYAQFLAHRNAAAALVADLKDNRRRDRRERLAHTCAVCHTVVDEMARIAGRTGPREPARVCPPCATLVDLARSAAADVPAGGHRLGAVLQWLDLATDEDDESRPTTVGRFGRLLAALR